MSPPARNCKHHASLEYPSAQQEAAAPVAYTNPLPLPFSPFSKLPWRPVSQYTPSNIHSQAAAADFNNSPSSDVCHSLIPSSSCNMHSPIFHSSSPIKTEYIMTGNSQRTTTATTVYANAYANSLHQDVSATFGLQLHGYEYTDMDAAHLHQLLTLQAQHDLLENLFHGDKLLPVLQATNKQYKLLPALQSADHAITTSVPEYSRSTSCLKSTLGMKHDDHGHSASTSTAPAETHYINMHSNYKNIQKTEKGSTPFEANVIETPVSSTKCTGSAPGYCEGRAMPEAQAMQRDNILSIINNSGCRLADGAGSFGVQGLLLSNANSSLTRPRLALCSEKVRPYNATTHKASAHKLNDHTFDSLRSLNGTHKPTPFCHSQGATLYSIQESQQSWGSTISPRMQTARLNASAARDYAKMREAMHSKAAANRRRRIQERLTALRALVPGGAKIGMHLASMLELATKYVRFLQAQHLCLLNEIHIDKHSGSTSAASSPHNGTSVHMPNHSIQGLPVCLPNLKSSQTVLPNDLHDNAHALMPFLAYLGPSPQCQTSQEHSQHLTESFCAPQSPTGHANHEWIVDATRPDSASTSSVPILADKQHAVNVAINRKKYIARPIQAHADSSNDVLINVKHALHVQGTLSRHLWEPSANFSSAQISTEGEHVPLHVGVDDEKASRPYVAHAESAQTLSIGNVHIKPHVPLLEAMPIGDIEHETRIAKRRRVPAPCSSSQKLPSMTQQKVLYHRLLSSQQVQEHLCRVGACLVTVQQANLLNHNPAAAAPCQSTSPHFTG